MRIILAASLALLLASPAFADCTPTARAPVCGFDSAARQITLRMMMPRPDPICIKLESLGPNGPGWVQTNLSSRYPVTSYTPYAGDKGTYSFRVALFLVDKTNSCDMSRAIPGGGVTTVVKK